MAKNYQISDGEGASTELDLIQPTLGTPAVDVRGLAGKQGVFT